MGRADWHPLSHGQEALWFLWKLVPRTWAYSIVLPVGVRGPLAPAAFRRALQQLSDRHPSIRTELAEENGKPVQRPLEGHRVRLEEIDASAWPESRVDEALVEQAHEPFDLERDVTLRATLFRRAADHHILLIAVHHIVSDLWSLIVLMDELRQLYAAEREGRACTLPPLPMAVEDHAAQQRELVAGEAGEALWAYWQQELSGDPAALDLPADHSRPAMQAFRGGTITRRMNAGLTRSVKELSGKERVTPFMTLLAAYQVLLGRFTGQESFFVGTPTSGRDRAELQGVVGDFVNMVPVRADLTGTPTFREVLARVRAKVIGTIKHQDYPFSLLVERLQPARDLSRSPIFQTTFVLQKFHRFQELSRVMLPAEDEPVIPFADLMLEPIALAQQDGQFDVNLEMKEDEKGRLVGAWKYSAALFDASTIERMAGHFETLLGAIVEHPDLPIHELRLLSEDESRSAIAAGQGPRIAPPDAVTVGQLFEQRIAKHADAIAVSCGNDSVTYAELGRRVTDLAHRLVARGVRRDALVALKLPRGLDFITAILAIHKAGGAFLPLEPRHPASRTQQIVENSGAVLVLTPEELARLAHVEPSTEPSAELPSVDGSDLAYVMYTSGSTGTPKGVMVEHRGMVNHVLAKLSDLEMDETDVLAQNGPPTFDIVVWQCLAPLVVGGRVVVFPDEVAEDPAQLLAEVAERGITILQVVPSMLNALLAEPALGLRLRWMVPTGEALPTALCRRWLELYPHIPILNTYGSTECSDDQCHYAMHRLAGADDAVAIASIGTPIRNMTAHVLDSTLAPVPAGVVGELYIGGIGVGRGYLGDPARTATSFVSDPFSDGKGARLYRTRDHARRRADGALDFLGRTDSMIKLRGLRIEPGEIEAALTSHPAIREAAVVARTNPSGERVLVAYLVSPERPEAEELRRHLSERVPQSMIPSYFSFLESMPLSANGKHDHRALPAPEWGAVAQELIAPRTPTEERIAQIWTEVLGLDRVGVTQDFFAIGGDSIRSIQIVARCKRAEIQLRPSDLFQHATIAALAALADRSAFVPESVALPSLDVSQDLLDRALAQVVFDGE